MAENKTKPTERSVKAFIEAIEDPGRREDCKSISELMEKLAGAKPKMWGESIVGFGKYRYAYASGREGEWFLTGFSPRKQYLTLYIMGYLEFYSNILENLGKHKHGKGCLYIKRLEDIDMEVLKSLILTSIERARKNL